jgi:hypothetical protein
MFPGVLGRPVCVCGVSEIMTNLFFMLRDFLEFLEDLHQLIGRAVREPRAAVP